MIRRVSAKIWIALGVAVASWLFLEFAENVLRGRTQSFDDWVHESVRQPGSDEFRPRGGPWIQEAGRDITALGGRAVLTLLTSIVLLYLALKRQYAMVGLILFAALGGAALNSAMKHYFARERPNQYAHSVSTTSHSFPSGHASLSAVIYLSLGALLARYERRRRMKAFVLAVAVTLTVLVGLSRLYLGVHYATDVLAGWAVGAAWALLCYILAAHRLPMFHPQP